MTQNDLNRAVARAIGETVGEVAHRGFGPLKPLSEEDEPLLVDWDRLDAERNVIPYPRRRRAALAG